MPAAASEAMLAQLAGGDEAPEVEEELGDRGGEVGGERPGRNDGGEDEEESVGLLCQSKKLDDDPPLGHKEMVIGFDLTDKAESGVEAACDTSYADICWV